MRSKQTRWWCLGVTSVAMWWTASGCLGWRPERETHSYEASLTGEKVFTLYCSSCHNARTLAERPFAHYKNVDAHMRTRANLTGREHAALVEWMRRWHDVPPPTPPVEPSPRRMQFTPPAEVVPAEME